MPFAILTSSVADKNLSIITWLRDSVAISCLHENRANLRY